MADNIDRDQWKTYLLSVVCSHPAVPVAGDPVRYGEMTGIALVDEATDIAGQTSVDFGPFIARLSVEGDNGAPAAIAVGDRLFYEDAGTPVLNSTTTETFFGYALEAVGSGVTATIDVMHVPPSGV